MPRLEALATAVPEHVIRQDDLADIAAAYLEERAPELVEYVPLLSRAGVEKRHLSRRIPWYLEGPGWEARASAFQEVGLDLAEEVTHACLEQAGLPPSAVGGVVFVTTTGLATPSLEARLANRLQMRADLVRVPVWGLGCAGGVAGLARAADLARAHPDQRFLVVALELCSLAFLSGDLSKKNLVAVALFGDGCAGALVAGDALSAEGPRIEAAASHQWPDTERVMGWDVLDEGLSVVFSKGIPELVERDIARTVEPFLKQNGVALADARAIFHPGGSKVLEAFEAGLRIAPAALDDSRAVLAEVGNLSSPTVLFVLERSLDRRPLDPEEPALLAAVGPGFAAELALLRG